ncbi:MAG: DMT family transporter [Loktanella sp.]|nr:DMT family transporter [Loktanella sp.]
MVALAGRRKGILLTLLGVAAFSPDAMLVRLIDADVYSVIIYKAGLMSLVLVPSVWLHHRGALREMWRNFGMIEFWFGILFASTMFAFVSSLGMTSVANVLVMIALGPLFSASFAWLILGERVTQPLALTILSSFVGVAIIVGNELWDQVSGRGGALDMRSLLGCFLAMLASAFIGMNMVLRRLSKLDDSMPALVLGGFIAALLALPFANLESMDVSQVGYAVLLGAVVMPLANTLIFLGPRLLSAPEVSVLWLLEVVLGSLWVWIVLHERPGAHTIFGGGLVVVSLLIYFAGQLREQGQPIKLQEAYPRPRNTSANELE